MIILGIDPGSITTGYAFIEKTDAGIHVLEYGVLHAPASHAVEDRLLHIVTELEALLDRYRPDALAMEGRSCSGTCAGRSLSHAASGG